jgi:hypothetical protein
VANLWLDQEAIKRGLSDYFELKKSDFSTFGRTVNQTFEAFVFVTVARWYANRDWKVEAVNTKNQETNARDVHLKFSTRGRPDNYTYFKCSKADEEIQIRHQLRVATYFYKDGEKPPANICLDVAVIESIDLSGYGSDDYLSNPNLVTFGEAKHMSAFAELVAGFIGLVHELQPSSLKKRKRRPSTKNRDHLAPFLFVSGLLNRTAQGIKATIEARGYDIDIYNRTESLIEAAAIPTMLPKPSGRHKRTEATKNKAKKKSAS